MTVIAPISGIGRDDAVLGVKDDVRIRQTVQKSNQFVGRVHGRPQGRTQYDTDCQQWQFMAHKCTLSLLKTKKYPGTNLVY
jgi:hypothetical protein